MAAKNDSITDILREALFGKKKKTGKKTAPTQEKLSGSTADDSQISLLRSIAANARISAKNSMALPGILQQTNIMQKNVAKLVRLQGSNPSNKADVFFSNAKFREGAYEASYRKNMGSDSTSPTKDKPVEKKSIADLFGSMFGIFKSVFNVDFLKKVLIGGAIIGGLTKYFGDSQFREQVNTMLDNFRKALITDEAWEKLKSGLFNLGLGALAVYAAFKYVAFKLNTMAIANAIGGCGCGTPVGPVGAPGGRNKPAGKYKKGDLLDKKGKPLYGAALEARKRKLDGQRTATPTPKGRFGGFGTALNAVALAGFGYNMLSSGSEELGSMADSQQPGTTPEATRGPDYTSIGINTLFAASTAGSLMYNARKVKDYLLGGKVEQKLAQTGRAQSIIGKIKELFTKARAKSWGPRFLKKLSLKLSASAVGRRILPKVTTAVAGFFFPGPGWLATIFSLIWIAADLYFLYITFESIYNELVREDAGGSTTPTSTDESSKNTSSAPMANNFQEQARVNAESSGRPTGPLATGRGRDAVQQPLGPIGAGIPSTAGGSAALPQAGSGTLQSNLQGLNNYLRSKGLHTSENKQLGLGFSNVHKGKGHNEYQSAFDVNLKGAGNNTAEEARILDQVAAELKAKGYVVEWRTKNHSDHLHVEIPRSFEGIQPGWTHPYRTEPGKKQDYTEQQKMDLMPPATTPQVGAVAPQRSAGAFSRPTGGTPNVISVDNSTQVVNAPSSGGQATPAAMPSVYNPEMYGLSNLLRQGMFA